MVAQYLKTRRIGGDAEPWTTRRLLAWITSHFAAKGVLVREAHDGVDVVLVAVLGFRSSLAHYACCSSVASSLMMRRYVVAIRSRAYADCS